MSGQGVESDKNYADDARYCVLKCLSDRLLSGRACVSEMRGDPVGTVERPTAQTLSGGTSVPASDVRDRSVQIETLRKKASVKRLALYRISSWL
ncbi:hypothetical protein JCM9803A_00490 [Rhodococcus erythropolis]